MREARTDRLGQFKFVDLPQGALLQVRGETSRVQNGLARKHQRLRRSGSENFNYVASLEIPAAAIFSQRVFPIQSATGRVNLSGTVKDYSAGFVKNAILTLTLLGSSRGPSATTNENGEFQFTDLSPGKYTLKVTHKDYFEVVVTEFWVTPKNLTTLTPIYVFRKNEHSVIICQ